MKTILKTLLLIAAWFILFAACDPETGQPETEPTYTILLFSGGDGLYIDSLATGLPVIYDGTARAYTTTDGRHIEFSCDYVIIENEQKQPSHESK